MPLHARDADIPVWDDEDNEDDEPLTPSATRPLTPTRDSAAPDDLSDESQDTPPADPPEVMPVPTTYVAFIRLASRCTTLGVIGLALAALGGFATLWLEHTNAMPAVVASGLRSTCFTNAIVAGLLAMCTASAHAGLVERRSALVREHLRAEGSRLRAWRLAHEAAKRRRLAASRRDAEPLVHAVSSPDE